MVRGVLRGGLLLLLVTGAACARLSSPGAAGSPSVIVLDSPENLNTFLLVPDAPAKLSASAAFDAYLAEHPSFTFALADATDVQLGYLTTAVGDGTYTLKDRLAWGFSWNTPEIITHSVPTDFPTSNTWWMFVDANTGERLWGEWQLGA